MRNALGWAWRVLVWVVLLGALAILTVAVVVPRIGGATPYTILTGSMRPGHPPGTLVVMRPVAAADLRIGDVVTYQLASGEPEVVTHRIVALGYDASGGRIFRTQGDANDAPDQAWVRPVQIRGRLWYSVPYLGWAEEALTVSQRQGGIDAAAAGLLGYAGVMFVGALRDRRKVAAT
ncbi:MAG: signal peptidase I [Nocardioides sp.]|uniref:signal peptidase I n=1 Tax=Nocardioides sp. TaxID=35761 RepID=UPI0039E33954